MLKIKNPNCPTCGQPATSLLETAQLQLRIDHKPDGSADYTGEFVVDLNTAKSTVAEYGGGNAELICACGQQWVTEVVEIRGDKYARHTVGG